MLILYALYSWQLQATLKATVYYRHTVLYRTAQHRPGAQVDFPEVIDQRILRPAARE